MKRRPKTKAAFSKPPESSGAKAREAEPSDASSRRKPAAALYLVATPIGNLGDLTIRARETLAAIDIIACEDTRVTKKLLSAHGIDRPLTAYHEYNATRMRPRLIERLKNGQSVALLSDAGTPLVSDPGYKLVRAALEEDLAITALPGPSAVLSALLLSGLPCDRFLFGGFLPPKTAARKAALSELRAIKATLVFFESPRRLAASLTDMANILGNRQAAVARELTKRYEEVRRRDLTELAECYRAEGPPKGEVVVVVAPALTSGPEFSDAEVDAFLRQALTESGTRDAAARVATQTGLPRRMLYDRALALGSGDETGGDR